MWSRHLVKQVAPAHHKNTQFGRIPRYRWFLARVPSQPFACRFWLAPLPIFSCLLTQPTLTTLGPEALGFLFLGATVALPPAHPHNLGLPMGLSKCCFVFCTTGCSDSKPPSLPWFSFLGLPPSVGAPSAHPRNLELLLLEFAMEAWACHQPILTTLGRVQACT